MTTDIKTQLVADTYIFKIFNFMYFGLLFGNFQFMTRSVVLSFLWAKSVEAQLY